MATPPTFVIAGASLAGAKAAETLRSRGFEGRVVLIGDETERPYERPPLSKGYLRGEVERHKVYVHDEGFYADQGIELRTATRVQSIQLQEHKVVTLDDEKKAAMVSNLLVVLCSESETTPVVNAGTVS